MAGDEWVEAVLGLGANIGDRRGNLAAALSEIGRDPEIEISAVSSLYETAPWGKTDQPAFLNAAALVATTLPPQDLLERALRAERSLGRERLERWGPRLIDIDILLFGSERIEEPGLTIPHHRLKERAFALVPLCDLKPSALIEGRTAVDWLSGLDRTGIERISGPEWARR